MVYNGILMETIEIAVMVSIGLLLFVLAGLSVQKSDKYPGHFRKAVARHKNVGEGHRSAAVHFGLDCVRLRLCFPGQHRGMDDSDSRLLVVEGVSVLAYGNIIALSRLIADR